MIDIAIMGFFSCFIGNGLSPIHFFICNKSSGVYGFLMVKIIYSLMTGSLLYPSVWFTFLAYIVCMKIADRGIACNVLVFYVLTNVFCFFEMSLLFGWYPFSFLGFAECMVAGMPYAFRGLMASELFALVSSNKLRKRICRLELSTLI